MEHYIERERRARINWNSADENARNRALKRIAIKSFLTEIHNYNEKRAEVISKILMRDDRKKINKMRRELRGCYMSKETKQRIHRLLCNSVCDYCRTSLKPAIHPR
jgi:hypothetical protein